MLRRAQAFTRQLALHKGLLSSVLSREILVKAKYRIGTWYWHFLNIKGLDRDIPNYIPPLHLKTSIVKEKNAPGGTAFSISPTGLLLQ